MASYYESSALYVMVHCTCRPVIVSALYLAFYHVQVSSKEVNRFQLVSSIVMWSSSGIWHALFCSRHHHLPPLPSPPLPHSLSLWRFPVLGLCCSVEGALGWPSQEGKEREEGGKITEESSQSNSLNCCMFCGNRLSIILILWLDLLLSYPCDLLVFTD